jgi:hypothetical protein
LEPEARVSYVYALGHPDFGLFYVGKGKGQRVYSHEQDAGASEQKSEKLRILRELKKSGKTPTRFVVNSGLTDDEASNLEAILIEFCRKLTDCKLTPTLSNLKAGAGAHGFMLQDRAIDSLNAPPADLGDKRLLLLSINASFDSAFDYSENLPTHVAGRWVLSKPRAEACAAYRTVSSACMSGRDGKRSPQGPISAVVSSLTAGLLVMSMPCPYSASPFQKVCALG